MRRSLGCRHGPGQRHDNAPVYRPAIAGGRGGLLLLLRGLDHFQGFFGTFFVVYDYVTMGSSPSFYLCVLEYAFEQAYDPP